MPAFVRVRDKSTGHQYDVPAGHPQLGKSLEPLKDKRWPDLSGHDARPRPPLHSISTPPEAKVSTTKKEA